MVRLEPINSKCYTNFRMVEQTKTQKPHKNLSQDVEVAVTSLSDRGGEVKSFYTNMVPKLKIKTNQGERELEVVMASVEDEDKQLLHELLKKTRKS